MHPCFVGIIYFTHIFLGLFLIVSLKISHEDDNYMVILFIEEVVFELLSKKPVEVSQLDNGLFREEGACARQRRYTAPRKGNGVQLKKEGPASRS